MNNLSIALVHHPVRDREGATVTTAITNMDLHDMARSARTFAARPFYVVHPIDAQRALAERIREHWVAGSGRARIPDRAIALEVVKVMPTLQDVYDELGGRDRIELWTTAAKGRSSAIHFPEARKRLAVAERRVLLLFGTGWGLTEELLEDADVCLEPIFGPTDYNHLSVRAACAITLDRLCAPPVL
jgi:hypothetical protein